MEILAPPSVLGVPPPKRHQPDFTAEVQPQTRSFFQLAGESALPLEFRLSIYVSAIS
jgi:hypothetical protein